MQYFKFVLFMTTFHVCRGLVNALTTVGCTVVNLAVPEANKMDPAVRDKIENTYRNVNKEWN